MSSFILKEKTYLLTLVFSHLLKMEVADMTRDTINMGILAINTEKTPLWEFVYKDAAGMESAVNLMEQKYQGTVRIEGEYIPGIFAPGKISIPKRAVIEIGKEACSRNTTMEDLLEKIFSLGFNVADAQLNQKGMYIFKDDPKGAHLPLTFPLR